MGDEGKDQIIQFTASLPTTSNAIALKGDGSAKVVLELSASELSKLLPLTMMGEMAFKVTIEPQ